MFWWTIGKIVFLSFAHIRGGMAVGDARSIRPPPLERTFTEEHQLSLDAASSPMQQIRSIPSFHKPTQEFYQYGQILTGSSVHSECYPNSTGHRQPPCILNPLQAPSYFMDMHAQKILELAQRYKSKDVPEGDQPDNVISLNYVTGDFAYLPCRTLGESEKETMIWELVDTPLFVGHSRFLKETRYRLITTNTSNSKTPDSVEPIISGWDSTNQQTTRTPGIGYWDLIVDFLNPNDSNVYTCRLIGRTLQQVKFILQVKEAKPLVIYKRNTRVQVTMSPLIRIGQSFNLTCSVRVNRVNMARLVVDWFRPGLSLSDSVSNKMLMSKSDLLQKMPNTDISQKGNGRTAAAIRWLADSFVQLISQPVYKTIVYKETRSALPNSYWIDAVYVVEEAKLEDGGLYECRVYEPLKFGAERVLDRAITNIIVHQPFPQSTSKEVDFMATQLAKYWGLTPEKSSVAHEQYAQNDGSLRLGDASGTSFRISHANEHAVRNQGYFSTHLTKNQSSTCRLQWIPATFVFSLFLIFSHPSTLLL